MVECLLAEEDVGGSNPPWCSILEKVMHWKYHAEDCQKELGNAWFCVHHWLDEFAGQYWPSKAHRAIRHHREGVEEVRRMWGSQAAQAAEMHIIADEGCVLSEAAIEKKYGVKR